MMKEIKTCQRCELLGQVIDELSELLARTQRSRRIAYKNARDLQRLLIDDMEEEHARNLSVNYVLCTQINFGGVMA